MGCYWQFGNPEKSENLFSNFIGYYFNNINSFFINGLYTTLMMLPVLKNVIKRESSAKLYRLSSFYISLLIVLLLNSIIYAVIFTPLLYYTIDFYYDINHFLIYFCYNFAIFTFGQYFGLCIGANFSYTSTYLVSPICFITFMLGYGFFRGNSSLPSYLSWFLYISPYRYFMELTLKNFADAKDITKSVPERLDYNFGFEYCIYYLVCWISVILIIGFMGLKFYTAKF